MNQIDYGMRVYDPRIGKFLSVDPLTKSFAMLTPYQYASNRPIDGIDMDGLEFYSIKDSRIHIGLQFDAKLKKITSFSTYYRSENIPDALNDAINRANKKRSKDDPPTIGSTGAQVLSANLAIQNPFVKSQFQAEAKDINIDENSSMGPSSSGSQISIIPKNKKEASYQEKNRTYFTEGASPRIGKANALAAVIDLATTAGQYVGTENIKSIIQIAQGQSLNGAVSTIAIIQNAIDNGTLNGHLDYKSLTKLANYLLYGAKIEKYVVVNGQGSDVEDVELTQIANQLLTEYFAPLKEKERKEQLRNAEKPKSDNTRTNNR